jgi:hypothetical protein
MAGALPANAAYPVQDYYACPLVGCESDYAFGTITWYNRTAGISGYVRQVENNGTATQVKHRRLSGIDSDRAPAPDRAGVKSRARLRVCDRRHHLARWYRPDPRHSLLDHLNLSDKFCGTPVHYWRKDAS